MKGDPMIVNNFFDTNMIWMIFRLYIIYCMEHDYAKFQQLNIAFVTPDPPVIPIPRHWYLLIEY